MIRRSRAAPQVASGGRIVAYFLRLVPTAAHPLAAFQIALDELPRTAVGAKSFEIVAVRVGSDIGNGLTHVTYVKTRISPH